MKFKTERLQREWVELADRGGILVAVVATVDAAVHLVTGAEAVMTDMFRTEQEQIDLCEEMGLPHYRSVHEFWRGADFRSVHWTPEQAHDIVGTVNGQFAYGGRFVVAKIHQKGTAQHLHCQVPPASRAVIWRGGK